VVATETGPTAKFFRDLATRGYDPLLARVTGTVRFDIADGSEVEHWYVTVRKGDLAVSHKRTKADVVAVLDRALADRIFVGDENATASLLRGVFRVEGDLSIMVQFQRLFPGPPESRDVPAAGYAKRMG
jgi:SCP-2 sterol transfer family